MTGQAWRRASEQEVSWVVHRLRQSAVSSNAVLLSARALHSSISCLSLDVHLIDCPGVKSRVISGCPLSFISLSNPNSGNNPSLPQRRTAQHSSHASTHVGRISPAVRNARFPLRDSPSPPSSRRRRHIRAGDGVEQQQQHWQQCILRR